MDLNQCKELKKKFDEEHLNQNLFTFIAPYNLKDWCNNDAFIQCLCNKQQVNDCVLICFSKLDIYILELHNNQIEWCPTGLTRLCDFNASSYRK